ncbi:unnamed protein product [Lactuca saligna]|uniref:chloroplast protein-transporting ATPase n=2 Tax=Lactuca TaxID=4235 RepID=A0AA36E2C8_LACSI|nr:unnamed protein product [Lactuca saligna]
MADRRATEIELDTMEGFASREKLHHHLNDQADLIQEIDSKLPVVQLALELTHKIFGSCPPMQSFDPAKMLTDYGKLQTLDITVACRKSSCKVTSTSVPPSSWTPRSQTEILQLGNLKPFSFNVLKLATRNFRLDNVLGEGGSGSVFKGWIDEQSVKRLNQAIFKSSGPCCLTIQLMDVGNAKTDVVAVSVDHNFSTYLHNGFLSVVPGKKDSGIMLQRNKCQFSGIDESSAISAVMEGVHVVNGLEYKMYCSSSKFDGFQKNSIQMVKPAKGTTTLAFIFKEGVMVAADSRASMGGYIFDGESGKKRRWSEGIHLAVEAKEGLPIQADSVVVAQITYQSMFKLYPKLSGMTGTAKTEHPTFIAFYHTSILFKKDIFHKALYFENYTTYGYSSKYVGKSENKSWTYEKAKSIISESIEMSQSMGLDELQRLVEEQAEMYPLGPCIAIAYLSVLKDCEIHCFHEGLEVKRLGGLHVIGTSLHESRRIDNQLRGRAGRQGDPGSTRFMVR